MVTDLHSIGQDQPVMNMRGERVVLGPIHRGMLPFIERWQNDVRTADLGGDEPRPVTSEAIAAEWEPLLRGERSDWLGFAIYAFIGLLEVIALFSLSLVVDGRKRRRQYAPEWR